MKRSIKITSIVFGSIVLLLYFSFLVIFPNTICLDKYKKEIQNAVKSNSDLNIDYESIKIKTTPLLEAGIVAKNIKITLPDGSSLLETDELNGKVFLPSLLWLSVRVTDSNVISPKINLEIINSEQYKVARVYENFVNNRRQDKLKNPEKYEDTNNELPIDISKIKFFVNSFNIKNYSAIIDETKTKHKLTFSGDNIKLSYNNGKTAKIKTDTKIYYDETKNVDAKIKIDTFLPEFAIDSKKEDAEEVYSIPFVNPVKAYGDYDLKSNIETDLKIRYDKKNKKPNIKGFLNIDNTTVKLSGLVLPESYIHLIGKGYTSEIDTNLYVTDKEYINIFGKVNYGKSPSIDLYIKSPQVYFNNLLKITKAYLDTIHIKNNIEKMAASGFFMSNARIKTDFKKLKSSGQIIIRNGALSDSTIGLLANNINANFAFMGDLLKITDAKATINGQPIYINGKIDSNSIISLDVLGKEIPIKAFYNAFASREMKNNYSVNTGTISIDAKIRGEIKSSSSMIKTEINNLSVSEKAGNIAISNKKAQFNLANISGKIVGKLTNNGFVLSLPKQNTTIRNENINVNIDNSSITINPSDIIFNKNSKITLKGIIKSYLTTQETDITANGKIETSDIVTFIGKEASLYLDKKGSLPVFVQLLSKGKTAKLYSQLIADSQNYITPVNIKELVGNQTIFQLRVEKNKDLIKLNKTGIYTRKNKYLYDENLYRNLAGAKTIVSVKSIISNLNINPFVNLLKVTFTHKLNGSICIFPRSYFNLNGNLLTFGKPEELNINGHLNIKNLNIPEIMTRVNDISINLGSKKADLNMTGIKVNDSDFKITATSPWKLLQNSTIKHIFISSRFIDINKVLKTVEALDKNLPKPKVTTTKTKEPSQIPIEIESGLINFSKIVMDKIYINNTTADINLRNSILNVHNLKTYPIDGDVYGRVSYNLLNSELKAKLRGRNFDVEKALLLAMNMKDTLSGNMTFVSDISMKGTDLNQQLKTLSGYVDFDIKNGQLGPFGKFENFLMAENIRENAFFSSAIGSIITNIVTIDTSRYNNLYGHLTFDGGKANISPIKTQGNVMSLFIFGDLDLLDNTTNMKVRGKLASAFSDSLGPLSNVNPVNLIKHTPGLNIVAAKTFSIFCEAVSQEEMDALPDLGKGKTDENATKFQIRLSGDTRKPLKLIKSFKWLALNSEIESAKEFVDTLPIPQEGEENMSVEELIELRQQQALEKPSKKEKSEKASIIKKIFKKKDSNKE